MTGTAHPPARVAAAAFLLPGARLRARARSSRSTSEPWQDVGPPDDFPDDTYIPKDDHDRRRASARPARRTVYVRKRNPQIDTDKPEVEYNQFVAISTRCMHLGCPVRYVDGRAALHLPVPRRRLRLPRQVAGGPPVRPLDRFYTRVAQRPRRDRPALLGQPRAASASRRATPASRSTASASTCTRRARRSASSRAPERHAQAQAPRPAAPRRPRARRRKRPGDGDGRRQAARRRQGGRRSPSSTGSTSARRCPAPARWLMFRKVPKGTNWFYTLGSATMFAFLNQAVTGVFLAMYYDPSPHARLRVGALHHQRGVPRRVRARHAQVGLVGDGDPRSSCTWRSTFFFGAYKYPRELNWVIGVVLLILTMVMSFTGYLLPFDQRSYWATIVGVNINGTGPLVGPYLSRLPARRRPSSARPRCRASTRSTCCSCPGADRRADRRAPVPRRQARHHGAAVAEGRAGHELREENAREPRTRRSSTSASTRS